MHATEKLAERHHIHLSVETVRNWMTADGLFAWQEQRKLSKTQTLTCSSLFPKVLLNARKSVAYVELLVIKKLT